MFLVGFLSEVRAAGNQLEKFAAERGIANKEERAAWQAEKMAMFRPIMSPQIGYSITRLMPLDKIMAAHLHLFYTQYLQLEKILQRISKGVNDIQSGKQPERHIEHYQHDNKMAKDAFDRILIHASCADYLLSKYVLSKAAFWNRIISAWLPDEHTKNCYQLLKDQKYDVEQKYSRLRN